jgi:cytochrome c oxidase assembly factor CtaG
MSSVAQAVLRSWAIPPDATFAIVLSALVYLRGWWLQRRAGSPDVPPWRAISFLLGLFTLWFALASPMDVFNGFILTAHMLQHMLLMMVAPPLVLLGAPLVPMVRGLPVFAAREFAGPFLNWPIAKRVGSALTHPVFALLLMGAAMFAWHTPALYELALRSSSWHQVEHSCFFLTSIIFWWPVVQPWPSKAQWPRWAMVPYLLIADLQNTALSAILTFSDRALYPSYSVVPRLFGLSALEDQAAAGAMMWVVGSLAFVVPAVVIAVQCLSRKSPGREATATTKRETSADVLPALPQRIPLLSGLMHRSSNRKAVEAISFLALFVAAALCFARLSMAGSDDDNEVLRLAKTSGSFAVAIFAPAGDLTAGPSAFCILVQDPKTREVVLDASVQLNADPVAGLPAPSATMQASHGESENKLLQSAELNLPAAGDWLLNISVQRNAETAQFSLPLHVVKEETAVAFPWVYAAFLTFAAILLLAYLRRHLGPGKDRSQEYGAAVLHNGQR